MPVTTVAKLLPIVRACCDPDCMSTVARTKFDEGEISQQSASLAALGDATRLRMIRLLSQHESLCVCELEEAVDVGQATVSHHLRILRDAGLVNVQRRGTWAYYSLRRDAVKDLVQDLVAMM